MFSSGICMQYYKIFQGLMSCQCQLHASDFFVQKHSCLQYNFNLYGKSSSCYGQEENGISSQEPSNTYTDKNCNLSPKNSKTKPMDSTAVVWNSFLAPPNIPGKGPPPEPPVECCMTGCVNCVWITYAEELKKYYSDGGIMAKQAIEKIENPSLKAFLKLELGI